LNGEVEVTPVAAAALSLPPGLSSSATTIGITAMKAAAPATTGRQAKPPARCPGS
jgi:hypothetical protein